jgi:hypothetical protein
MSGQEKIETITINSVEYVRADSIDISKKYEGDIKIVVLDRGFVYIGRVEETDDFLIIRNASNLRIWGTSKGLGELVNGPLSNTKMDKVGTVRAPNRALISLIDVEQKAWNSI